MDVSVVLVVFGIVLILFEFFIIPGSSIAGMAGFVCSVIGVFHAYYFIGWVEGTTLLLLGAASGWLLFYFLSRSRIGKMLQMKASVSEKLDYTKNKVEVGDIGETIGRLMPAGNARINNEIFEVTAMNESIEEKHPIIVVKVQKNRIFVKRKQ
jgi:membrane-bound ClpP family serine protease